MSSIINKVGLTLFLVGFFSFLSLPFLGSYLPDASYLTENLKEEQYEEIIGQTPHFWERTTEFNKGEFIKILTEDIERVNENWKRQQQWDKVVWDIQPLVFNIGKTSLMGPVAENKNTLCWLILLLCIGGGIMYTATTYQGHEGIKNNKVFFYGLNSRGVAGIALGLLLISFYILLYFYPVYITEWTTLFDPISQILSGSDASQWTLYGILYTSAVLVMGIKFIRKYRHNKYQRIRTYSVMFFQLSFAFLIPDLLARLSLPAYDLKNIWPLDYTFFFEWRLNEYIQAGTIGYFMLGWGIALVALGVPLITYFYGKRWYCSWVCGCGGLAETAGDPFRHQSDKRLKAWKFERIIVHSVLVFAILMTAAVLYTFFSGESQVLGLSSYDIRKWYGFAIGSIFSGVIGTGFYPLMGNRVWCRFGCPLAAYLGIVQRFKSRFRITTNGGQCISCGNCSTYCEMGIDVKWYAQRGQNIVRSSCVGCGICSAVCPRGVLKLENGPEKGRFQDDRVFTLGNDGVKVNF